MTKYTFINYCVCPPSQRKQWSPLRTPSCPPAPVSQPRARWGRSSASCPARCTGLWTGWFCPAAATQSWVLTPWASPCTASTAPGSSPETTWCVTPATGASWRGHVSTLAVSWAFQELFFFFFNQIRFSFLLKFFTFFLQCLQKNQWI